MLKLPAKAGQKVTVKQKKHAIYFGTTAFMLGIFEKPEKEIQYKEAFANLFNQAVVPFYWSDFEPQEGHLRMRTDSEFIYRRPAPDTCLEFCSEYGIEPKGHCLTWNNFVPKWLEAYSPEERKEILERRFKEIADEYALKIPSFDIVNESASNYRFGAQRLFENYDEYGLQLGEKYFPDNIKILNETNEAIWRDYYTEGKYMAFNMQLQEFIRRGIPFDEIGLQYHIFNTTEEMENPTVRNTYLDAESMLEITLRQAREGDAKAQNNVAAHYRNVGDCENAIYWYRKAVAQGDPVALFGIGQCYAVGCGVSQDYSKAAMYIEQSAEKGVRRAQYAIAEMYEKGIGVRKDTSRAAYWKIIANYNN
jgi:GH35 family endo-1,4-beta-xylanase